MRGIGFDDFLKEIVRCAEPYPPEFRRRALDLLASGRSVRDVAAALGIAESCLQCLAATEGDATARKVWPPVPVAGGR